MIMSAEEFVALRTSENSADYRRAATEPASEDTWRQVIATYPEMVEWVAHNKTIPVSLIRELFAIGSEKVRLVLAIKRSTPVDLLAKLATDHNDSIHLAVARHPKTTAAALSLLRNDDWEEVRQIASGRLGN